MTKLIVSKKNLKLKLSVLTLFSISHFTAFLGQRLVFSEKLSKVNLDNLRTDQHMCKAETEEQKIICKYLKAGRVESNNSRWLQVIPPQFSYSKSEYILLKFFIKYNRQLKDYKVTH